VRARWGR